MHRGQLSVLGNDRHDDDGMPGYGYLDAMRACVGLDGLSKARRCECRAVDGHRRSLIFGGSIEKKTRNALFDLRDLRRDEGQDVARFRILSLRSRGLEIVQRAGQAVQMLFAK